MPERIPQSTAKVVVFRAIASSDHITPATSKTIAITISKNGGAFGNLNAGATNATEITSGFYKFTLDTTDSGTKGPLAWRGAGTGIDDTGDVFEVVNATNAGFTGVADAVAGASGGLLISGSNSGTTTFGALTITGQLVISDGVDISCTTSNRVGFKSTGNGTGHGAFFLSGTGATGNGLQLQAQSTNGTGFSGTGNGSGSGILFTGGATGNGMKLTAGAGGFGALMLSAAGAATAGVYISSGGNGITIGTSTGDGININVAGIGFNIAGVGADSPAISLTAGGTSGDGLVVTTTDGDGINLSGIAGAGQYGIDGTINGAISNSGLSTLTQSQVTGGAYALNSASFAFNAALDFTTTQKAATLARVTLTDTATNLTNKGDGSGFIAIPWNAAWDAEVQSEVQDAIEANHLDHFIAVADPGGVVANSSFLAKLASKSATPAFSSFDNTTDSLEAIRDRGDAAWITATGFSTHTAADVWAVGTRVLTAGTNIVLAKGTGVTGFNDITAAAAATAVWIDLLASSDFSTASSIGKLLKDSIDAAISSRSTYAGADTAGTTTLLSRIGSAITISGGKVAATVATGDDADAASIKATIGVDGAGLTALGDTRIANLDATVSSRATTAAVATQITTDHGAGSYQTATGFAAPGDAMTLTGSERNTLAAVVLRRTMTNVFADAAGDTPNKNSLYGFIQQAQKSAASGGVLTIKNPDGTTLGTLTLVGDAGATPVIGVS